MRDSCRLEQPKFNTFSCGQRSFRYYGSKLWNLLPYSVKNTKDLNVFKSDITRWCHSKQRDLLDVFWKHARLPLCLYFIHPFIPLSIILDKYMSIYSSVFSLHTSCIFTVIYAHVPCSLSSPQIVYEIILDNILYHFISRILLRFMHKSCLTSYDLYPTCILSEYWQEL